jgi:molybdopterin molybdotransferase
MISEEKARDKILETVRPLPARHVSIVDALDCFATEDCFARLPLPTFDNSQMDGYAITAGDGRVGKRLRLTGEQPAGVNRNLRVFPGETVRIFTGAPMPAGADAVVMQEEVTRNGDEIVINTNVAAGEFIRRRGCDLSEGQKILGKGERIRAATLALLASQGCDKVAVGGKPRVAIVSTGDELATPGKKLRSGQIYESNSILLQSLLRRCGVATASIQHCKDSEKSLQRAFETAARNEVLIVSGGVSVGEHDLVQSALRDLGGKINIWRVAIKPGKPFLFGRLGKCALFGLPGNPVSAFVTFLQFVRPAILKIMGAGSFDLPKVQAKLTVDLTNDGDRVHYFRGTFESGNFVPVGRQESHALFGLSRSNALLRLAVGESRRAGDTIEIETWD